MNCLDTNLLVHAHQRESTLHDPAKAFVKTPTQAFDQIHVWKASPSLTILNDSGTAFELLEKIVLKGKVTGPMVHDARIAACCLSYGVSCLYTIDRDFSRFPQLKTSNPLVG